LGILLLLLLVCYFLLQLSSVQNYIKNKVLTALSEQYDAKWTIGDISVDFFDQITASDILFLDQQNDTLLSADELTVDIGVFQLIRRSIVVDDVRASNVRSKIYALDSSRMNFSFLIPEQTGNVEKNGKPWSFGIQHVALEKASVLYQTVDMKFEVDQDKLAVSVNKLDLEN